MLLKQMRERGVNTQVICGDGAYGAKDMLNVAGKASEGYLCSMFAVGDITSTSFKEFEKKYAENYFQPDPENVWIYVEGRVIKAHLPSGTVEQERFERRPLQYPLNFLHLNHAKGGWTWMADLYAVALAFLAISGLLMLRKKSLRRGLFLTSAGILIPVIYLMIYY